jgi:tetratricopeptide (TPR) repeat protein
MGKQHHPQLTQATRLLQQQQYMPAIQICDAVLARDKRNLHALFIKGHACYKVRRLDEAARILEHVTRAKADDMDSLLALAHTQLMRTKYASALRLYDRALKLDSRREEAIVGKAQVYDRQKNDDKLAAYLEPLVAQDDPSEGILTVYASMLERANRPDEAVAALHRKYPDGAIPRTNDARVLLLQKGRLLEKLGRYEDAMAAYLQGQGILGQTTYDPQQDVTLTDALIDVFSGDNLTQLAAASNDIELPVFIIGMPRTGSTLIDRIINAHPQAASADEVHIMGTLAQQLPSMIGSSRPWPHCMLDSTALQLEQVAGEYVTQLRPFGPAATRIVDKMLLNYRHVGLIIKALPHARIIDCRRDPMDTCLSVLGMAFQPNLHPYQARMEWIGQRYNQYQRLMDHWSAVLPNAMLTVPYEELVTDQETWTRRIIDHIGLPWNESCLKFYQQKEEPRTASREQVNRPIYRSSVGRAERFGTLLDPLRDVLQHGR